MGFLVFEPVVPYQASARVLFVYLGFVVPLVEGIRNLDPVLVPVVVGVLEVVYSNPVYPVLEI